MPSSAVLRFTDPDHYAETIRASTVELTVIGRGSFAAEIVRINLHRMWMQRFSDNLPRIVHAANVTGRAIINFCTEPGPSLLTGGLELRPGTILRYTEGQTFFQRSSGPVSFGAMSLPIEEMMSAGATMRGVDLKAPRDPISVAPDPVAMARLQHLHAAAGQLAEHGPEVIANPEAARGLEQELVHAMVDCLAPANTRRETSATNRHTAIMKRFRAFLEANSDRALHLPELCKATGASDRTLRACCQEALGMSPVRYLWLRRMQLTRRALALADPVVATVTEIATAHGFWELGRFSVQYRALFGERPSTTLHRPPDSPPPAGAIARPIISGIA